MLGHTPVRGLVLATGHYRNGILLAPITAWSIAELVASGQSAVDLRAVLGHALRLAGRTPPPPSPRRTGRGDRKRAIGTPVHCTSDPIRSRPVPSPRRRGEG